MDVNQKKRKSCSQKSNIEKTLEKHGLYRVEDFKYNVGDCLFDTFQYLLKFQYTSIQICNGIIDFFVSCLHNNVHKALNSYNHELHPESLQELHNVKDTDTYL